MKTIKPPQPGFRAYRNAAMNLGAVNAGSASAVVAWDSVTEATGVTLLAGGVVKPHFNGRWELEVIATIKEGFSWSETRLVIERDQTGTGSSFAVLDRRRLPGTTLVNVPLGAITMGAATLTLTWKYNVLANELLRCRVVALTSTSNIPLIVGEADTKVSFIRAGQIRQAT